MEVGLQVVSFAAAGSRGVELPEARTCPLPKPGHHPRRARLPGLAVALSREALKAVGRWPRGVPPSTAVFFGSGLGCMTETEAFVENMIEKEETTPMPRAFSSSVHNTMASRVAMDLKAQGDNQTFVHGDTSFLQALFAADRWRVRGEDGLVLIGGVDESTPYVVRGRAACDVAPSEATAEGGAVFVCAPRGIDTRVLAVVRGLWFGRPRALVSWARAALAESSPDLVLTALRGEIADYRALLASHQNVRGYERWTGDHPSSIAVASAVAIALIAGEIDGARLGVEASPERIALLTCSRFGDAGMVVLGRAG